MRTLRILLDSQFLGIWHLFVAFQCGGTRLAFDVGSWFWTWTWGARHHNVVVDVILFFVAGVCSIILFFLLFFIVGVCSKMDHAWTV